MKKRSLRLSTRILLLIIPSMILLLLALAQFVYSGLYGTIIEGFENKLMVLGSLNAAMIDGETHQALTGFRQETAVCVDPINNSVYFGYAAGKQLARVVLPENRFDIWSTVEAEQIAHLAFDPVRRVIMASVYQSSNILLYTTAGELLPKTLVCPGEPQGIACDGEYLFAVITNRLFVAKIETNLRWEMSVQVDAGSIWGLTLDKAGMLAALDVQRGQIVVFSATNTNQKSVLAVIGTNKEPPLESLPLRGIARVGESYICGSLTEPVMIDAASGILRPMGLTGDGQRAERDAFAEMSRIIARVHEQAGLTYMPSVIITENLKSLVYVVDTATDEFHSLDGYVDPTELEEGIIDSWTKNRPYISAVKFWDDYGLMKSSYYPILDNKNHVQGLLAADINVSIIQEKTLIAVRRVAISGSITLLVGIIIALSVARRIVNPVRRMKDFALKVAAGGYGESINVSGATEIKKLMIAYNQMSCDVRQTLDALRDSSDALDTVRKNQELESAIDKQAGANIQIPSHVFASRRPGSSLCLSTLGKYLIIMGGLESVQRAAATNLALKLMDAAPAEDVLQRITKMLVNFTFCIIWDQEAKTLHWLSHQPFDIYITNGVNTTTCTVEQGIKSQRNLETGEIASMGVAQACSAMISELLQQQSSTFEGLDTGPWLEDIKLVVRA